MTGPGIRSQFEEKFRALIRDIEVEVCLPLRVGIRYLGAC